MQQQQQQQQRSRVVFGTFSSLLAVPPDMIAYSSAVAFSGQSAIRLHRRAIGRGMLYLEGREEREEHGAG